MSHNHFKMSGVLNGFREVRRARTSYRACQPGVEYDTVNVAVFG